MVRKKKQPTVCLASRATKPVHRKEHHQNRQSKLCIAAGVNEMTAIFNSEKKFLDYYQNEIFSHKQQCVSGPPFRRQNSPVLEPCFLSFVASGIQTSLIGKSEMHCIDFNLKKTKKNGFTRLMFWSYQYLILVQRNLKALWKWNNLNFFIWSESRVKIGGGDSGVVSGEFLISI